MPLRPNHIPPQTSKQAKAAYKKTGPRLSERDLRQIERNVELQERADRIKEKDRRRKLAQQRREEKEKKDRESRQSIGVGLATQIVGYSRSQARMKSGMESFLGLKGEPQERRGDIEMEMNERHDLGATSEETGQKREPWDMRDGLDMDVIEDPLPRRNSGNSWSQDGLDDKTLLQLQEQAISEPWEETAMEDDALMDALVDAPKRPRWPAPASPSAVNLEHRPSPQHDIHDIEYIHVHGPTNQAIEKMLASLPDPLIELLSQDLTADSSKWNPAPSLLHRLTPLGIPPHRLQVKVGCSVVLLRDLNTSSQLSRSSHLRILKVAKERLECVILDGQLEGMKTFLTRVSFPWRWKNQDRYLFTRTQFPVRVVSDLMSKSISKAPTEYTALSRAQSRRTESMNNFKTPTIPASMSFKPPSCSPNAPNTSHLPTMKAAKSASPQLPPDCWDDFLASGTQIAREISSSPTTPPDKLHGEASSMLLSTQDLGFSFQDLEELTNSTPLDPPINTNSPTLHRKRNGEPAKSKQKLVESPKTSPRKLPWATGTKIHSSRLNMPHSPRPSNLRPVAKPKVLPRGAQQREATRETKAPSSKDPSHPIKPPLPVQKPLAAPSFRDFGISTQDVVSLLEDDDGMVFSSPPITA